MPYLRRLLELHHRHHRVGVVRENADHRVRLVVEQHRAAGLELLLVHEGHDRHVVLAAHVLKRNEVSA